MKGEMENIGRDYAAGFAAGLASVFIGHPFDTVKVKLQTQSTRVNALRYHNAIDCTIQILKTEGVKGLYKGATSSFVGVAVESSLLFGAYSQMKFFLQGGDISKPQLSSIIPSAAVGGACISFILCPAELVKCRLQVQSKGVGCIHQYNGPLDCIIKTLRAEGVNGLFRGGVTTFMRESIGTSIFFTTYEISRYHILRQFLDTTKNEQGSGQLSVLRRSTKDSYGAAIMESGVDVISGGLAGMMFWLAVLPLDVAKTRIQTTVDLTTSKNPLYNIQLVYRNLGFQGLYAGLGPTLLRAFPANAAAMFTWELTAKLLGVRHYEERCEKHHR